MTSKKRMYIALFAAIGSVTCAKNEPHVSSPSIPEKNTTPPPPEAAPVLDCDFVRRGAPPEGARHLAVKGEAAQLGLALRQSPSASPPVWVTLDQVKETWSVQAFEHDYAPADKLDESRTNLCAGAVGKDGLLCPTTVVRGAHLSKEQATRLFKLRSAEPGRNRLRCYDPRMSFVWFDENAVPRVELTVCLDCSYWSVNDGDLIPLSSATVDDMKSLCVELGFCKGDTASVDEQLITQYRAWESSGAPRPLWSRTSAQPNTPLSQLSPEEKRQLCAERAFEGTTHGSLEYESGEKLSFLSYEECVDTFPSCDVPLDALDYADFSIDRKSSSFFGVYPHSPWCYLRWLKGPLGGCHWGVKLESTPSDD